MNLIIDVGNTNVKLAVFQEGTLLCKKIVKIEDLIINVKKILKEFQKVEKSIISSVGKLDKKDVLELEKVTKLTVLSSKTKLPFRNLYKTPKTLGVDRIALVCASVHQYSKNNVLIIDAGTCITFDFITEKNNYLGGAISPGIKLRYYALNNLTANLPLLEKKMPKNIIGKSTEDAIHSGVINGVLNEIDGIVQQYDKKYEDLTVILTGGDADFLSKRLKSSIFANSNFLLEGLNFILEFNSK